ncbi:hypothetical protein SAMN05444817_10440 [Corynebacterium appendicis CIP 107643]|uniref:Deacetylase n=1 Tax=Corynebacterium appendicis CIP 107643 TaxID=1161099 RepID=A0A1N7J6B9_9CORY|nr:DUF2334 domain-containing protein [Corynebacterium appendicis]WJY61819.1 hypothetical protein CAPP_09650 [Corynebacterium appendicis CIP 107643]SIS44791.1 hypothetical protein SAMN05444817_10440 [Corynebacterium appendicis CIP 107643]
MSRHLLVSVSSIFDETRKDVQKLVADLERESIQVSLLVAPHIDKKWHLAKDDKTRGWLKEQMDAGRGLILNGFDQPVQGRRAEFANLGAHEAKLRLKGATRQMEKLGFELDTFAPPRWRMSEGTLEALHKFDFRLAASTQGVHFLRTGEVVYSRNLSVGEGFGAAGWWRRNIIDAAVRSARRGNTVRLSVSGRNLSKKKVRDDFVAAALAAAGEGLEPVNYRDLGRDS